MAILCVHLGVGPDSPPSTFLRLSSHIGDLSVFVVLSLSPFSPQHPVYGCPCLKERMRERERVRGGDGGFYGAGHQPAVNVPAGTDGISADEEKENAPPSSLTFPVDPGALNKMDVLGSRIERNCTVDSLKCHRRRRHGLPDGAPTLMRRNRTRSISTDPI